MTRLRPTRRGVSVALVAIIVLAVAMGTGDAALLLVLVVVALPLVIAPVVVLARAHRAAGIEVHMMVTPPLVPVGAPSSLLVQLSPSGGPDPPPFGLDRPSDHWSARAPSARQRTRPVWRGVVLASDFGSLIRWDRISSDASTSSSLALPTSRRGVFTVGPLRLWVHDPFALFGQTVAIARPVRLVVHPPALAGPAMLTARPGSSGSTEFGGGPVGAHMDDPGGEWSGLRPYEPGDRLHLLSWQAEARFGTLLVHDFRPESADAVTIVIDDRAGVHRRHAFENALSAVVELTTTVETWGTDYDISTLSGRRVRGSSTPEGVVALLTFLAGTQPNRSNNDPAAWPSTFPSGALVVTTPTAVTTLPSSLDSGSVMVIE